MTQNHQMHQIFEAFVHYKYVNVSIFALSCSHAHLLDFSLLLQTYSILVCIANVICFNLGWRCLT